MTLAGAVVVTGGQSRRMGRAKEWLEIDGEQLLGRVVRTVSLRCTPVVVSASPGQRLPELGRGVVRVDDPIESRDQGPLVGLRGSLGRLKELGVEVAYLASCDAALLSSEHVAHMIERLVEGGFAGVVPGSLGTGRCHPLASAVRVRPALVVLDRMLAAGERRAQRLFVELDPVDWIPAERLPDPGVLRTFNTPEEWASLSTRT